MFKSGISLFIFLLFFCAVFSQNTVPKSYSNLFYDESGKLYFNKNGTKLYAVPPDTLYTLSKMKGNPKGTPYGIFFNFKDSTLNGTLYFGFYNTDSKYSQPTYFKINSPIIRGKGFVEIKNSMKGCYDMIGWQKKGKGTIGYRIVDDKGRFIYDGKISFLYNKVFQIDTCIISGPFINNITPNNSVLSFETNYDVQTFIKVNNKILKDEKPSYHHEFQITGLEPGINYKYNIVVGINQHEFSFRTAPKPGTHSTFTFAYASDSRSGFGGGERDFYGVNAFIIKKIMSLSSKEQVSFVQFSGDLISGYSNNIDNINLEYANWKRAVEPFTPYLPIYTTTGNHEALIFKFKDPSTGRIIMIDQWPDETSTEGAFARNFVNPISELKSEDGASYDPDLNTIDFPSYSENVYYYTYDNVGMVVLNSNYFYVPLIKTDSATSGNLHGYIMDNQVKWLKETLNKLNVDKNIDHIFVSIHVPFFPNGGHTTDAMWYSGKNAPRAYVNGKPLDKGIIERRDELLEIIVNQNPKVVAILTGDEHNYCRMTLTDKTNIYPTDYTGKKIKISRPIYQITDGAAGAPYYAQDTVPWTSSVNKFTTQFALVLLEISGKRINLRVINPDTLEEIDQVVLKQ
jgi:hypothetical protein